MVSRLAPLIVAALFVTTSAYADSAGDIDQGVDSTLAGFKAEVSRSEKLLQSASATPVFPNVIKAGFGIGGE